MQIVYRATTVVGAQQARDLLAAAGIATHVTEQTQKDSSERGVIHVLVDNRMLDRARRTIRNGALVITDA
jgi:hypothetical protein